MEVMTEEKTYSTEEAIAYLEAKGTPLKRNTFYQLVQRGDIKPLPKEGTEKTHRFTESALNAVGPIRVYRKLAGYTTDVPTVSNSAIMARLVEEHGEVIDSNEAYKLVQAKDPRITKETAHLHLTTKVGAVGKIGEDKALLYFFPLEKVKQYVAQQHKTVKPPRRKQAG